MGKDQQKLQTLKISISSGSGDGAYLCYENVAKEIYDYFQKNKLDLEEYALDEDYAEQNNIPEEMQPFLPGERASFGSYECVMTIDDLTLTVQNEESDDVFCGEVPKACIKKDPKEEDILNKKESGIYAVGYEGLEDCYIAGEFDLALDAEFDIKKLKIKYGHIDYELGSRDWISSITYDGQEIDWNIDSYEGTGDNSFGFVVVD